MTWCCRRDSGSASCGRGWDLLVGEGAWIGTGISPLSLASRCAASTWELSGEHGPPAGLGVPHSHLLSRSSIPPFLFGNLYFLTFCLVFSSRAVCMPTFSWFLACLLSISDICPYISSYFLSPVSSLCTSASGLVTSCRSVPDSDLCSPFVASLSSVSSSSF